MKPNTSAPARISASIEENGTRLRIVFDGDPALLPKFEAVCRTRPKKTAVAFRRFIIGQVRGAIPMVRDRTGTFNPLLPETILKRFREACQTAKPPITQAEAIRRALRTYINVSSGKRKSTLDGKGNVQRDVFGQRVRVTPARELFDNPAFDMDPKEKAHFALGHDLKAAVEDLIVDVGVGKSLFFAFLLSTAFEIEGRSASQVREVQTPKVEIPWDAGEPGGDQNSASS